MTAIGAFVWALKRDLGLAVRRSADALNVLGFFGMAATNATSRCCSRSSPTRPTSSRNAFGS